MGILHVLQRRRAILLLFGADILFYAGVNPTSSNSFIIIAGCVLLALTVYIASSLLAALLANLGFVADQARKQLAIFMTLLLTFLLLLQSIGQLSVRDILAAVPLAIILYAYVAYSSRKLGDKSVYS